MRRGAVGRLARAVLALALLALSAALAQIQRPEPIDKPIPEQWRIPVEAFLRNFGFGDSKSLLSATKGVPLDDRWVVIRVEHRSTCQGGMCLTAIGVMQDLRFLPSTMFFAGKMMTQGDTLPEAAARPPVMFYRTPNVTLESESVVALETRNGWIVVPTTK
jgi:hypothetical protein